MNTLLNYKFFLSGCQFPLILHSFQIVLSCPYACVRQHTTEHSQGTLCSVDQRSLSVCSLLSGSYSNNSSLLGLPRLLVLSPQLGKPVRLGLSALSLCHVLETLIRTLKLRHLLCFLSLGITFLYCLMSKIFRTVFHVLCAFFDCFRQEG